MMDGQKSKWPDPSEIPVVYPTLSGQLGLSASLMAGKLHGPLASTREYRLKQPGVPMKVLDRFQYHTFVKIRMGRVDHEVVFPVDQDGGHLKGHTIFFDVPSATDFLGPRLVLHVLPPIAQFPRSYFCEYFLGA